VWKNHDGTVLETDQNVVQGTVPTFNQSTPIKPSTAEFAYVFSGWTPTVVAVSGNIEYTATFTQSTRQYTVMYNVNGGGAISATTHDYGASVSQPATPLREGYRFLGWYINSQLTQEAVWPLTIIENITLYAAWNETVPYGDYLTALLADYVLNPFESLPASMLPGSSIVEETAGAIDYTVFQNVSAIPSGGYGEQWYMVLTNLRESASFFQVLSIVDTLSSASIVAFQNYLDSNPANAAKYEFTQGIYQVTIEFKENVLYYVLDYTTNVPVFGQQTVQIALEYNISTLEKVGRIQIGEANALRYVIGDNTYQFGIRYAGVRRAYFEISEDAQGNVQGSIFEYLGIDGVFSTGSCAQFFINDDYVSVVGNKASGMAGWTGTINELYATDDGELIGYEVRETLSSITYNTLWFNLADTSGITTIKRATAPIENNNPYLIYVNGSTNVFTTKNVGGLSLKTLSRRFDIEFRTQYFFALSGSEYVTVVVEVPMLFVQEEQMAALVNDIQTVNSGVVTSFALNVSSVDQQQIMNDYDNLIDAFIIKKAEMNVEAILTYIGTAYSHE